MKEKDDDGGERGHIIVVVQIRFISQAGKKYAVEHLTYAA
jgi:hypothetical protein